MIPQPRHRTAAIPPAARGVLLLLAALAGARCAGGPSSTAAPPLVVSDRGGALRIYEVDRDRGVARLVGSPEAADARYHDSMPARLADGRVVFVSDRGGRPALYLTATDVASAGPLAVRTSRGADAGQAASAGAAPADAAVNDPAPADSDPAPGGPGHLLFARAVAPGAPRDLLIASLDGGAARALTRNAADDGAPCLLADGRTVIFVSDRHGAPRLYRLDPGAPDPEATVVPLLPTSAGGAAIAGDATAAGGAAPAHDPGSFVDGAPACLPDGSIVFARAARGLPAQLFAFDPGSARPSTRQVTDARILPWGAGEPVPQPDGTILLTAGPAPIAGGRGERYGVYRISGGGYNLARMTRDGAGYNDFARGLGAGR